MKIGYALVEIVTDWAFVAVAVMVGFVYDVRRREKLEAEQQRDPGSGKKPLYPLAGASKSAEP